METPSQSTHILRIRNIPSEIVDVINSYLFYTLDEGNHRKKMKQIESNIEGAIHFTCRYIHIREWGFRANRGIQFESDFCVKCGNYHYCHNNYASESVKCICHYGPNDIDHYILIEEERWPEDNQ